MNSSRDNYDGDTSNNINVVASNTSVTNLTLLNALADASTFGNGLSAVTNNSSILNLVIDSPVDPLFTGTRSSFSNNNQNGQLFTTNDTSFVQANINNVAINVNTLDGMAFHRFGASLVRADVTNSSLTANQVNGLSFRGLGSDPQDPTQQLSGTPNRINLVNDLVNANGTGAVGNGARVDLFGDAELVLNATTTTFNNNKENGVRVAMTPGAEFGYTLGAERSTFDGVTITGNSGNGIFITSEISATPATDPNSLTFMEINSNLGNTLIAKNTLNGILLQYPGGTHDLLITGDTNPAAPTFTTAISGNTLDGIHVDTGLFATTTLTVDGGSNLNAPGVIVGGPLAANRNGGDGIDFEVVSQFRVVDGATTKDWLFNAAGTGNLIVNNTTIQNNGANGLNLVGNNLEAVGIGNTPTQNNSFDPSGLLNATVTNSRIVNNVLNGVNIDLQGQM